MKKKMSIHDIAKHLKVSATTVSFVLNDKAEEMRIGAAVKKKVLKYAKKINYQPNLIAKSLRTGKSKIIGMMVEDISDPFFAAIARGIEHRAYKLGYKIFFASTENDPEKAKALLKVFRERQVDSYIIAPPPGVAAEIKSLVENENPVILFDRYFPELQTTNVVVDNYDGAFSAVAHLLQNGYSQIGFVTLDSEQTQMQDRLQGYHDAVLQNAGKPRLLKVSYTSSADSCAGKINDFIRRQPGMDALLFGTNYLAFSGLEAINELALSIPGDLAVVSFDDSRFFRLFSPAITAVAQPVEKISEAIINCLQHCLDTAPAERCIETVVLKTEFIIRQSSLKLRKQTSALP